MPRKRLKANVRKSGGSEKAAQKLADETFGKAKAKAKKKAKKKREPSTLSSVVKFVKAKASIARSKSKLRSIRRVKKLTAAARKRKK
jgi:hypothetical protein